MADDKLKQALIEAYKRLLEKQIQTSPDMLIPPSERSKLYVVL